ncbi:MAG: DUF5683 domain-containing protein [Paludibacter sp.]|jgi:hypothetical protein|nr:DUF5683 domain-containing protein [Paludibacter sp.]
MTVLPSIRLKGLALVLGCCLTLGAQTTQERLPADTTERAATLAEPSKVIWWGAAIPGYGQILNKKYWKLPIVYAGFLGCYYAINWNSNRYVSYKNGYLDITDTDDATNSYLDLLPEGRTIESFGGRQAFTGLLKSGMDQSRYYRDLTVIISIAYYGLTIIDAFVDAHLADFDISSDLSMRVRPMVRREQQYSYTSSSGYTYGLTGSIKF